MWQSANCGTQRRLGRCSRMREQRLGGRPSAELVRTQRHHGEPGPTRKAKTHHDGVVHLVGHPSPILELLPGYRRENRDTFPGYRPIGH